jgi:hypothetical protein
MRNFISLLLIIALLASHSLRAQEQRDLHPYLTENFFIDVGMFYPERSIKISVNGSVTGPGDKFDFAKDGGLKSSDEVLSLNFGWRFGEKWQLGSQYFKSSSSSGALLDEDVKWGDVIFGEGTAVSVGQDFALVRLFFARRLESRNEQHEFGFGVGIHWLEIGAFIEGNIIIGGTGDAFRRESVRAQAPLPNIGAWYTYSMSPRWAFKGRLDWLSASIGDYSGTMTNVAIGLNFQAFENFGVDLYYNDFTLNVGVKTSDWRGTAETAYKGLFAGISIFW